MTRKVWISAAILAVSGCASGSSTAGELPDVVGATQGIMGAQPPAQPAAGVSGSVAQPTQSGSPVTQPPPQQTPPPAQPPPDTTVTPPPQTEPPQMPPPTTEPPQQPATGSKTPVIPAVTADCPAFRSGTISFMGLGGITMQAGSKASNPSAPMVFYWHGTGSFAGEYAGMAGAVHQGVMSEGGVLISFQGTTGGDLLSGTAIFGKGDFELADQFVACAVRDHNIDPRRIFATGCSAGGLFSGAMAAARSNYMAAAAPNSGGWTVPVAFQNDYTPALMTIHGAAGRDVVIIDFSNSSRTADMGFKNRGGFVINCDHGGGHCGGGGLAPDIWEFFKAHPYGVDPTPWTSGLPSGFDSDCKIF